MTTEREKLSRAMEQAQVFASAWSMVGGRFDAGHALDNANDEKELLRKMLSDMLAVDDENLRIKQKAITDVWVVLSSAGHGPNGIDSPADALRKMLAADGAQSEPKPVDEMTTWPTAWLHELEFVDGSDGVDYALSFTKDAFPMDSIGMFRSIKQTPLVIPIDALPITRTRVGNHLRRHANGDNTMYCNGFKDGVQFAEENHGISRAMLAKGGAK